jgi:hypothetical protein
VPPSLLAYLLRRLGLLLLTVLIVPSLSFIMFTLIQGDVDGPVALARELAAYLAATFIQADLAADVFRGATFARTQGALEIVRQGLAPDVQLMFGGLLFGVVGGLSAGSFMAVAPRSLRSRALGVGAAFVLSSPVYWLGFVALILFSPGFGAALRVPFLSEVGGYRPFTEDPLAWLQAMWLPCVIAGAPLCAACARMAAGSLRSVLQDDAPADRARQGGDRGAPAAPPRPSARGPAGDRARGREHEPAPHERGADGDGVQHPRVAALRRAGARQPRRGPRPGARGRGDGAHRRGELPR